jgi:hypothetical protein
MPLTVIETNRKLSHHHHMMIAVIFAGIGLTLEDTTPSQQEHEL